MGVLLRRGFLLLMCPVLNGIFLSCTFSTAAQNKNANDDLEFVENLSDYPYPKPEKASSKYETLVLLGTNDLHGTVVSNTAKASLFEGGDPQPYRYAGLSFLGSYVSALRSEWGDHLVWLDAGDEFQGSLESNLFYGASMVDFFNAKKLNAAAIGNHEFDFGFSELQNRFKQAHYPYLSANVISQVSGKPFSEKASSILTAGDVKVGVIGLSTLETPFTTATNVKELKFASLVDATVSESEKLRQAGADIVVVVAHVGTVCGKSTSLSPKLYEESVKQPNCGSQDELVSYLNQLPNHTIDAVVSGHTHSFVHQWINHIPVIQSGAFGRYFSLIYLTVDKETKKIITDKTVIEGPVPVCEKIFSNQQNCEGNQPLSSEGRGDLVPFQYHGVEIQEDQKVNEILDPYVQQVIEKKAKTISYVNAPITKKQNEESSFGNLITDALVAETKSDIGIFNAGGIRSDWAQGLLTYGDVFRAFPFDNIVVTADLSGEDLITLLKAIQSGNKGFYPTAGVRQIVSLNPRALLSVSLIDGSSIDPKRTYQIVTNDFLLNGGDDFKNVIGKITFGNIGHYGMVRDVLIHYIQKFQSLNGVDHPLIDPNVPRLLVK